MSFERKLLIAALAIAAAFGTATGSAATSDVVAFVDVTVIPMTRNELRRHQTVLVEGERIVAMGPSDRVRVPKGARTIAGVNRYLLPGLIDMHVHFRRQPSDSDAAFSRFPDYRERNDDMGVLFVANGVTSVRQMHGHPVGDELVARSRGDWLGPTIYSTGPMTDGSPPIHPYARTVTTTEDAKRVVSEDKAKGYVAVKVYDALSLPVYEAIVAAAAAANMDVVGHVPEAVGLARAIAARQATIEHSDSFPYSLQPGAYTSNPNATSWHDLYQGVDQSKLTTFADELRRAGIWTCPTVVVTLLDSADYERAPETRYVPAAFRTALHEHWTPMSEAQVEEQRAFALALVRRLHERGAGLLLGTDTYLVVPGFSAIRELGYFAAAGLSPFEALQTGTINAARALHQQDAVGTVEVGKRADLLLLEGNPLVDLSNMKLVGGVMLRGRWLPKSELQDRLASIASAVATNAP
jgi:imidazolonepropionase-like amidohydrolase